MSVTAPIEPEDYSLEGLLAAVTPENTHAEIDWGEPVGEEVW